MPVVRSRLFYFVATVVVIACGLLSRSNFVTLPKLVAAYAGDTLWALMVFCGFGFLFPALTTQWLALLAGMFALLIELSQLLQWPWLVALRDNRFARLALGQGFRWSDLVCYAIGIACGVMFELMLRRQWRRIKAV